MKTIATVPLGEVADIAAGITLGRKDPEEELFEVPYLRVANVQDGRLDLDDLKTVKATKREIEKWSLLPGDLLLTEGGDPDKLGRGACWEGQIPRCIHQNHIFRVRLPADYFDPDFVSYQMASPYGKSYFFAHAKKTTGIASINQKVLKAFPLHAPSKSTQREIKVILQQQLAAVATASGAASKVVKDTVALKTSAYTTLFNHVTPIAALPLIQASPAGWEWVRLDEIARLESGHTPSRSRPDWWGGDVSWVSLTEIRALDGKWVDSTQLRTNEHGIANSAARILPSGTVCFSRTASVGFVTIMGQPMATSQDFANWVCGEDLDPEFLMQALICSRPALRELATGATHKTIYMPTLKNFHICAPPINEQRSIVKALKSQLAEAETLAQAAQAQFDDLSALPQRLLAQAFES
ncbi:MAG: hypothetical protein FKY71_06075 [Spiribacter salinus]|uniref:Type I restriction modification DNA specificity domain-containing protein n=1 Tax=Spiribacter salinus TaxID=1335746 RepID=A0A540VT33_9GAMM|nr:MAG: hypothetical protein FKY71_06075 [Spiribacter salinus]